MLFMRSTTIDVDGPVHVAEWGQGSPRFVLVHGLAGSHLNWMSVGPPLAERGRVLAPDLPGFGRTPVAGRRVDLAAQRRVIHRVLQRMTDAPVVLVGNSMGGVVALAEAALHPERVAGLVLVDSALSLTWRTWPQWGVSLAFSSYTLPPLALRLVRRYLDRHVVEDVVRGAFDFCTAHPDRLPAEVLDAHVRLERSRLKSRAENDRVFVKAGHAIAMLHIAPGPARRLVQRVRVPTLLIHGERDAVVNVGAARGMARERPDWDLRVLEDVGHLPMLEVPDRFLSTVESWLDARGLVPAPAILARAGAAS